MSTKTTTNKVATFVMAVVMMTSMAFAGVGIGSVSAAHNDAPDATLGDKMHWQGQVVEYTTSDFEMEDPAEIRKDNDAKSFVKEVSVNEDSESVTIDTSSLDAGAYVLVYDADSDDDGTFDERREVTFEIAQQTLEIEAAEDSITAAESVDFDITEENRASYRLEVTAEDFDHEELGVLFDADAADIYDADEYEDHDEDLVVVDKNDLTADFGALDDYVDAGTYEFQFDVVDSNADSSASVNVDEVGVGSATFENSIVSVNEGSTVEFTVNLEDSSTTELRFGGKDNAYETVIELVDADDSGEVNVTFNTAEAGQGDTVASTEETFSVGEGDDMNVIDPETEINVDRLHISHYRMELIMDPNTDDERMTDLGTMMVTDHDEPSVEGVYVSPGDITDAEDIEADLFAGSEVALEDSLVIVYEDVGFEGLGPAEHGFELHIEETNPNVNKAPMEFNFSDAESVYHDGDNHTLTVVLDADNLGMEDADEFDATFRVNASVNDYLDAKDYRYVDEVGYETTAEFSVTERSVEFDHKLNDEDEFEFAKADDGNITVKGSATTAPSTEYHIILQSTDSNQPFVMDKTVQVAADGTWEAQFNMSKYEPGLTFSLDITADYSENDDAISAVLLETPEPEPETFNLDVNVEDTDGAAIEGAEVIVDGEAEWGELEAGTYLVEANADGYEAASQSVTIEDGDVEVTLVLESDEPETFNIDVNVEDANGLAIEDAEILVDGEAEWGELEAGTYLVEANADGYEAASQSVVIADEDVEVTLVLEATTYSLDVTVEGEDGTVIPDATVTVDGLASWGQLEAGTYLVEANADGYEAASEQVELTEDMNITLTLAAEEDEGEGDEGEGDEGETDEDGPGFGIAVALAALLGAAMLVLRRRA